MIGIMCTILRLYYTVSSVYACNFQVRNRPANGQSQG